MAENKERIIPSQETITKKKEDLKIYDVKQYEQEPVPKEVRNWLEQLEIKDHNDVQMPVTDDSKLEPIVKLPISKMDFIGGFKQKISEAGRWLSIFVLRLIKKNKAAKIEFQKENE